MRPMDKATADSRSVQSFALNCPSELTDKVRRDCSIDISMRIITIEVKYFIKKYDISNVKIFQKNAELISSRDDPKTFIFLLKIEKNQFF